MSVSLQSSIQVQKIQAIGLTVTNLARAIDFYTKALHFEVISDIIAIEESVLFGIDQDRVQIATLQLGDEQIRLIQYLDRAGVPIPADSQSNDLCFQHLAIVVSDMEQTYAHLQSFEFEAISPSPQTIPPENEAAAYIQAFKFRDPDRHPLELIYFPPNKGQEKWHQREGLFLGIDHTAIVIANTEQSLHFYCDVLGMSVDGGSLNWGETQAQMDGLPDAKVQVTALRPVQGGLGIELLDYREPANGRVFPSGLKPFDIAYMQVELAVNQTHHQNNVEYSIQSAGQNLEQIQDIAKSKNSGCRIQDPTGHFLLLVSK